MRNIYSAEPHLTCRLIKNGPGVPLRIIYITRFGSLLPGQFCLSAPAWSARLQLLPRER